MFTYPMGENDKIMYFIFVDNVLMPLYILEHMSVFLNHTYSGTRVDVGETWLLPCRLNVNCCGWITCLTERKVINH